MTNILPGVWHDWHAILTLFHVFFRRLNQFKISVRTSNTLCSLYGWANVMITSLAQKYAVRSCIDTPSPFAPASVTVTTVTTYRITEYISTLKVVGDSGAS